MHCAEPNDGRPRSADSSPASPSESSDATEEEEEDMHSPKLLMVHAQSERATKTISAHLGHHLGAQGGSIREALDSE